MTYPSQSPAFDLYDPWFVTPYPEVSYFTSTKPNHTDLLTDVNRGGN